MVPIAPANSNEIEKELDEFDKNCKAKLNSTNQKGRLQLLIVILPDFKGRFYGKFSIKSKLISKVWFYFIELLCFVLQTI